MRRTSGPIQDKSGDAPIMPDVARQHGQIMDDRGGTDHQSISGIICPWARNCDRVFAN
jgi:hypothetical protein